MDNHTRLGEQDIPSLTRTLALPAITGMLVNAIYNVVDTFFVGKLNDTYALGAVSVAFPAIMIITAISLTFGIGMGALVSRLLGEKNYEKANIIFSTTVTSVFVIGIAIAVLGFTNMDFVAAVFGIKGTLKEYFKNFMQYVFIAAPFTTLNMSFNNSIRAEGNAKYSMHALNIGAVLNVILDPIFIFTFDMGVAGAAIATGISQGVSTLFLIRYYMTGKSVVKYSLKKFHFNIKTYLEIFKIGFPSLVRQTLVSAAVAFANAAATPFGTSAVASIGVVMKINSICTFVLFGLGQAFQPIVAFNYGAGKLERVKEAIHYTLKCAAVFSIVASILIFIFAEPIIKIFSTDKDIVHAGVISLRILYLTFPLNGFQIIITTLFQSLGRGKESLFAASARQGIFFIPTILVLPKLIGFYGVMGSQAVGDALGFILVFFLFRGFRKYISEIISSNRLNDDIG